MTEPTQPATVLSVTDLTPNVRQLVLLPQRQKLDFLPGQWVSLKLPISPHPPLNRAYSMAEPASPSGELTLVFDRVPQGSGSNYLYRLQAGDTVILSGPHGKFVLPQPPGRALLCITRYTGLVPVRCMLKALEAIRDPTPVLLVAVGPAEDELLYHFELLSLAVSRPGFQYLPLVAPTEEAAVALVADMLSPLLPQKSKAVPLLCGTKAFVHPLRQYLIEAGYQRKEIKIESYG
ncbi:MAG: FAD-binding oxidoreductase [Nitrospira sp.]|nr:FAD-binding oxidoreductase [Nitrospira sp.]MCP9443074.1 FAD-binding oxidoreductase [Nitrospira sp.]